MCNHMTVYFCFIRNTRSLEIRLFDSSLYFSYKKQVHKMILKKITCIGNPTFYID